MIIKIEGCDECPCFEITEDFEYRCGSPYISSENKDMELHANATVDGQLKCVIPEWCPIAFGIKMGYLYELKNY